MINFQNRNQNLNSYLVILDLFVYFGDFSIFIYVFLKHPFWSSFNKVNNLVNLFLSFNLHYKDYKDFQENTT